MAGAVERGLGGRLVAEGEGEGDIARALSPHRRSAGLDGVLDRDHGGQRLVVDLDQLGGVACLPLGLGDDEGDAVADAAHLVVGQYGAEGAEALGAAHVLGHEGRRQGADVVREGVGSGQHQVDAGCCLRLAGVHSLDLGVGLGGVHDHAVKLARQDDVPHVVAGALEEALVLDAAHRLPDPKPRHRFLLARSMVAHQTSRASVARHNLPVGSIIDDGARCRERTQGRFCSGRHSPRVI